MTNVRFTDEETTLKQAARTVNKTTGLTYWLIRRGIVKNQTQANILFMVIIVAGFVYIFANLSFTSNNEVASPQPDYVPPSEQ